jgi:hypothetical protein
MFRNSSALRGVVVVAVLLLSACASQVTRNEPASAKLEPVRALSGFTVAMSPTGNEQLADNLKFDIDALRTTLRRALESKSLIAADGDFELKVVVEDIRVRSTFNAVMWGFMAGDDHLNGTAAVLRRDGSPAGSFTVKTSYALGGIAGGVDSSRLGWLYEEFAKKLVDELIARRDARP